MVDWIQEAARQTKVIEETDVVICGSGPAGVTAAIAAARTGARTRLIEVNGCLGGVWTSGILAWIFEMDKDGIAHEIVAELDKRGARRGANPDQFAYDVESMKIVLEEMCLEAGVDIRLHTRVVDAIVDDDKRLRAVITESKSGREAWIAKAFVDATGDGDLGARAGCGYEIGNMQTGEIQPMTFMALVSVKDAAALSDCISFWGGGDKPWTSHVNAWNAFKKEIHRAGTDSSYGKPTLFQTRDNVLAFMVNHSYNIQPDNADQITMATLKARAEVNHIVDRLRTLGGRWEGIQLITTAEHIGVREGRRIHGRYMVTVDDLKSGVRHADAVTRVRFNVDIHSPDPTKDKGQVETGIVVDAYDIPYRALVAKDVDGLLMAGRCISGDWIAHSSYRVTGNAVAMGQAAGTAAALCAQQDRLPHEIAWEEVKAMG